MKFELYFPLEVWDTEKEQLRQLTGDELVFKHKIIEKIAQKYGTVIITNAEYVYSKNDKVLKVKSEVITVYTFKDICNRHFMGSIAEEIRKKLHQDNIIVAEDSDACVLMRVPD